MNNNEEDQDHDLTANESLDLTKRSKQSRQQSVRRLVGAIHDSQMAEEDGLKGITAGASQSRHQDGENSVMEDESDSLAPNGQLDSGLRQVMSTDLKLTIIGKHHSMKMLPSSESRLLSGKKSGTSRHPPTVISADCNDVENQDEDVDHSGMLVDHQSNLEAKDSKPMLHSNSVILRGEVDEVSAPISNARMLGSASKKDKQLYKGISQGELYQNRHASPNPKDSQPMMAQIYDNFLNAPS